MADAESPIERADLGPNEVQAGKVETGRVESGETEAIALKEPPRRVVEDLPPPAPKAVAPQRRSGTTGLLLGGVLAAGLGFGLAQWAPGGWPIADTSAIEAQLAAQEKELDALKAALAALPTPDATVSERLAAVETAVAQPANVDLGPLEARLSELETRLAAIEILPADGSAASPAAMAAQAEALKALQADVAALKTGVPSGDAAALASEAEARLKEAEAQAAAMKAEAETLAKAATGRAAFGQLQAALDSGAPFAKPLADLGPEVPAVLSGAAETGLPTLQALQASFPDAARNALEAALRADMGETWTDRVGSFLRTQTGARSLTPRDGADPDAVLSRASAALGQGDLATTLTELSALPEVAQAEMKDWRAQADLRLAGAAAIAALAEKFGG